MLISAVANAKSRRSTPSSQSRDLVDKRRPAKADTAQTSFAVSSAEGAGLEVADELRRLRELFN